MRSNHLETLLGTVFMAVLSINAVAEDQDLALAKQLTNPVASLISVPFQSNWDFRIGPLDKGTQTSSTSSPSSRCR